ncbi:MAG: hypothetical protein V1789_00245, partial [PVC group bacterium]
MSKSWLISTVTAVSFFVMFLTAPESPGDPVTQLSYQGKVSVGGTFYTGTGEFKFALVNPGGTVYYWCNDNTSGGGAPTNEVDLWVQDGLYDTILGNFNTMSEIDPSAFSQGTDLYLRVWFDDGAIGSQLLSPDSMITSSAYAVNAALVDGYNAPRTS